MQGGRDWADPCRRTTSGLVYGRRFQSCTLRAISTSKHGDGFCVCDKLALTSLADVCSSAGAPGLAAVHEACKASPSSSTTCVVRTVAHVAFREKVQVDPGVAWLLGSAPAMWPRPCARLVEGRHHLVIGVSVWAAAPQMRCPELRIRPSDDSFREACSERHVKRS